MHRATEMWLKRKIAETWSKAYGANNPLSMMGWVDVANALESVLEKERQNEILYRRFKPRTLTCPQCGTKCSHPTEIDHKIVYVCPSCGRCFSR